MKLAIMSRFVLLLCLVAVGYFAYRKWSVSEPVAVFQSAAAAPAKPQRVDFDVKSRVSKLLQEWKRRRLSTPKSQHGAASVDPDEALKEIRQSLFRQGRYTDAAMDEVVAASLRELGVAEGEIGEMTAQILSMHGTQ